PWEPWRPRSCEPPERFRHRWRRLPMAPLPPRQSKAAGDERRRSHRGGSRRGRGEAVAEPYRPFEAADLPVALTGSPQELAIGVDGDGMADGLQHWQVGRRVRV